MNWLILILFFVSSSFASTLGQYHSSSDGSSLQQFKISSSKIEYEKLSNFFDTKKDYTLGKFSSSYKLSEESHETLEKSLNKIKDIDAFMKKKNSSFNDLSEKNPHQSFIILDGYRVAKESDLYPELKKIYDELASQKWKQESGIKVSDDLKNLIQIKDGKETSREAFNFAFHCKKAEPPSVCAYKDLGILYVNEK